MSLRDERLTTRPPKQAIEKPKKATLPHCPGETHASPVKRIPSTIPTLVGLKICFPFHRKRNLLEMAIRVTKMAVERWFVRRRRHSERLEIKALAGSNFGSLQYWVQKNCAAKAVKGRITRLIPFTSNSSDAIP